MSILEVGVTRSSTQQALTADFVRSIHKINKTINKTGKNIPNSKRELEESREATDARTINNTQ